MQNKTTFQLTRGFNALQLLKLQLELGLFQRIQEKEKEQTFSPKGASANGKKLNILLDLTLKSSYLSDFM